MAENTKNRQKTLLPTLKERQRYVVYEVRFEKKAGNMPRLNELIIKECNNLLGVFDAAKAGIMNVKYDDNIHRGIMRVENTFVDKIKVCLGMMTSLQDTKVNIDCIYVSGMINKAEDAMIRGAKNE